MLPTVGRSDFFHSRFKSQDRAAIPVGRLSSWLAPASELSAYEANCAAAGCTIDTPRNSPRVVLCSSVLTLRVRARLASVLQRRAFTRTGQRGTYIECDRSTSRGSCALATASSVELSPLEAAPNSPISLLAGSGLV